MGRERGKKRGEKKEKGGEDQTHPGGTFPPRCLRPGLALHSLMSNTKEMHSFVKTRYRCLVDSIKARVQWRQAWMSSSASAKCVCVCVRAHACMREPLRDNVILYFTCVNGPILVCPFSLCSWFLGQAIPAAS